MFNFLLVVVFAAAEEFTVILGVIFIRIRKKILIVHKLLCLVVEMLLRKSAVLCKFFFVVSVVPAVALNDGPEVSVAVINGLLELDFISILIQASDIQAQRLKLLEENLEGLRNARARDVGSLNDRLVCLDTADDIIRLHGQNLLQRVGCAVCLECPDLHFSETLAAELSLAAQRLLCNQRVRAGRTCMDLIVDQMVQLQVMHVSDRGLAVEELAGTAVAQLDLAVARDRNALPERSVLQMRAKIFIDTRIQDVLVFC